MMCAKHLSDATRLTGVANVSSLVVASVPTKR